MLATQQAPAATPPSWVTLSNDTAPQPFCERLSNMPAPVSFLHASLSTVIFGCVQILTSFVVLLFLYYVRSSYARDNSRASFASLVGSRTGDHLITGEAPSSSHSDRRKNLGSNRENNGRGSYGPASATDSEGLMRGTHAATTSPNRTQRARFLESVVPQGHSRTSLLVLPVYHWALWGLALTDLMQGVANVVIKLNTSGGNPISTSLIFGFAWGSYHFLLEGLGFLLMQQGCGRFALRRTLCFATFWGLTIGAAQTFAFYSPPQSGLEFCTGFVWDAVLFLVYTVLWLFPAGGLPCAPILRPALVRIYAPFWSIFHLISCVSLLLKYVGFDIGICIELIGVLLPFALVKPFVVYFTLRADSRYWMGLGNQTDPLQQPLLGSHLPADSARELAQQLDTSAT